MTLQKLHMKQNKTTVQITQWNICTSYAKQPTVTQFEYCEWIKIRSLEPLSASVFQIAQEARWRKKLARLRCQLYRRFQPKRKCQRGKREISASLGIHAGRTERERERRDETKVRNEHCTSPRGEWRYSRGRTFNFQRFRVGRQFSLGQNLRRDRDDNHNRETVIPPGAKEPLTLRWSPKDSVFHRGWYIRIISSL